MHIDDFFEEQALPGGSTNLVLRFELLRQIRQGMLEGHSDLEVALALTRLATQQFLKYGTDRSQQITDTGSREAMRTVVSLARRLGIDAFDPPFRDFSEFKAYWEGHGGYGNWAARRTMVADFFGPLQRELESREDNELSGELADPIATQALGWAEVDEEIRELRRHFHAASTAQDYRNIGNDCVAILEALSAVVYDAAIHLREGEVEPPVSSTKNRIDRYIEDTLVGPGNAEMRVFAKKLIELAQAVKHNSDGTRGQAGIAADSVIALANMLRRLKDYTS